MTFGKEYAEAKTAIGFVQEPVELRELAEFAMQLAESLERAEWRVGDFCMIDFKTRGLKLGLLVKKNPKKYNVLILSDYPPRNERRWRIPTSRLARKVETHELAESTYKPEMDMLEAMQGDWRRAWFEHADYDVRAVLRELGRNK